MAESKIFKLIEAVYAKLDHGLWNLTKSKGGYSVRVKMVFPHFILIAVLVCCALTACDAIDEIKTTAKEVDSSINGLETGWISKEGDEGGFWGGMEAGYNDAYNKARPENDGSTAASDEKSASPTSTVNGSVEKGLDTSEPTKGYCNAAG